MNNQPDHPPRPGERDQRNQLLSALRDSKRDWRRSGRSQRSRGSIRSKRTGSVRIVAKKIRSKLHLLGR